MALVSLENVSKTFAGGVHAVRHVSLQVADGEFVVMVGPSGCGKSTTLRLIAGLEDPSEGTIRIGDRVVTRVHPKDRNIAMVFQNYALYPHMTVFKNMAFALKLRKVPKSEIDRRVREAAQLLGITELLNRKPRSLSGGQRQRVAVGRAIVREPACFLFDEPLSNLDVKLRVQMRAELKALHLRLKTTAVYVTHDQEEAMTLGERIAVMNDGVIQQCAPPLEVYRKPVNRFVAGFVGMPPMNFLNGRIERNGDDMVFREAGGGRFPLSKSMCQAAAETRQDDVIAGIRPESLQVGTSAYRAAAQPAFAARVRVVEPLGDRQDIYLLTEAGAQLVARIDASVSVHSGDTLPLSIKPDSLHLFEAGTSGRHLLYG